jgi:NB-ARC domain
LTGFNFGLNITDAPDIGSNLFVGREKDLERLNDILSPDSTPADRRVVILGGLGGMGKTQLAITYAKLRRTHYDSVFWLNASSKATLQQSFRSVAARIGILASTGSSLDDDRICIQISWWLSELENRRWLLIFDNYDEPDKYDIKQYFPDAWQGSIIITTRSPEKLNGNVIPIRKLDHNESIQILRRRSERNDVEHGKENFRRRFRN